MNKDIVIETAKRHTCFYVYDGDGIRNTARELSNALANRIIRINNKITKQQNGKHYRII
jgi:diaminopimelate decarboxylase